MPNQQGKCVVIKRNRPLLLMGMVAICIACRGAMELARLIRTGEYFFFVTAVEPVFLALWILTVFLLGVCALVVGSQRMVLSHNGVCVDRFLFRRRIAWDQISDWGLSHDRRFEIILSHLYFSGQPLPVSQTGTKKFSIRTIRIFIPERDRQQIWSAVSPYCQEHLQITPFDGTQLQDDE